MYLDIYVNLRAWIQRSQYCRLKSLLKMACHFKRASIAAGTALPLRCAEHRHAELAVYKHSILDSKMPQSTHLTTSNY